MYSPNPVPKIAVVMVVLSVAILGYFSFYEVDPGTHQDINVRTQDGVALSADVFVTRDYGMPTGNEVVTVSCAQAEGMTAHIDITVSTYTNRPVSQVVKDELQDFACQVFDNEPDITFDGVVLEETK